jgi:large subunit ribosomal protein L22
VPQAIEILSFTDKKTAGLMRKLVESAVANVEEGGRRSGDSIDVDTLKVSAVTVDAGPMLRRFRPRAQGRATKILKKTSHITVVVSA